MSTGYLHQALIAAVLDMLPTAVHSQISSWMKSARLSLGVKSEGNGVRLAYQKYTSAIYLKNITSTQVDTASLFAQIAAWLVENDEGRHALDTTEQQILIDIKRISDSQNDFIVEVVFNEPLILVPNPEGAILFDTRRWSVSKPTTQVAQHIDVVLGLPSG